MSNKIYELGLALSAKMDSSFSGAFKSAKSQLSGYEQAVNSANRQKLALDKIIGQTQTLQKSNQAFMQAKAQVSALASQIKGAKAPSEQLRLEFARAQEQVKLASAAYEQQKTKISQLKAQYGVAGQSLSQMSNRYRELTAEVKRATEAQRLHAVQQKLNNAQAAAGSRYTKGLGQVASAAGLAYAANTTLKPGVNLEYNMSGLDIASGANTEQMERMRQLAIQIGRDTTLSADEAAAGMTQLAKSGYSVNQIMATMPKMAAVAEAAEMDIASATNLTNRTLKAFGLGIEDAGRMGDLLAVASNKSNKSLSEMGETLAHLGPMMSQLGISAEETAGLAVAMDRFGVPAEQLQLTLSALKAPTNAQAKALGGLGLSLVDASGKQKDMVTLLSDLNGALGGMDEAARNAKLKEIFGNRAFLAAGKMLQGISDGTLPDLINAMGQEGAAAEMARKRNDNLVGDFKSLASALDFVRIQVFDCVREPLREVVKWVGNAVTGIGNFIAEHQTLFKVLGLGGVALGTVVGALGVFNVVLGATGYAALAVIKPFFTLYSLCCRLKIFSLVAGSAGILGRSLLFTGKAALNAAGFISKLTIQLIRNSAIMATQAVKASVSLALSLGRVALQAAYTGLVMGGQLLKSTLAAGAAFVATSAKAAAFAIGQKALAAALSVARGAMWAFNLVMAANPIGLVVTAIGALVAAGVYLYQNWDMVKAKAAELWGWFSDKFPNIAGFVSAAFDQIVGRIEGIKQTFSEMVSFVQNLFSGDWGAAWENAKNVVGNVFSGLVGVVKAPINGVIALINRAFSAISGISIEIPDWVPMFGGKKWELGIPQLPMLAEGGVVTSPTLALIGEGREAEAVQPLSKLNDMLAAQRSLGASEAIPNAAFDPAERFPHILPVGEMSQILERAHSAVNNYTQQAGSSSSENVTIHFSPNINISGAADNGVREQIQQALTISSQELKREIDRYFQQKSRLNYV